MSGADLISASDAEPLYVHTTSQVEVKTKNTIVLEDVYACWTLNGENAKATGTPGDKTAKDYAHSAADIFCMVLNDAGEVDVEPCVPAAVKYDGKNTVITCYADGATGAADLEVGKVVLVDYYVKKTANAQIIEITADKFAGSFYLEGSTLFRRQADGVDLPAEFIIPNGKIQSNFTFSMASTGDPSEQMRLAV